MRTTVAISLWIWAFLGTSSWGALQGCGMTHAQRAETTLSVLAEVIQPAHEVATDVCLNKQAAIVAEMKAQKITPTQADGLVQAVRQDCDRVDAAFKEIERLHGLASDAYSAHEDGKLDTYLAQLKAAWASLNRGGGGS